MAAAVVLVAACVVGGVVLLLIPVSIPAAANSGGSYPPVPGPPIVSCPAGIAGTGWGTLFSSSPDGQLRPRAANRFAECHDAAVQRAVEAGGLVGVGVLAAVILFVLDPGVLEQATRPRRRADTGDDGAPVLTIPVGLVASVLGVGCLLGGFLWIASSA